MLPSLLLRARLLALGFMLVALMPLQALAQADEVPTVTRTFAIQNARIVQAPGQVIERGTVLVRDGLILSVGTNVSLPFDAERIDGDSLTVYAGFISGLSHAGVPKPKEEENQPRVDDPGNPPDDVAGIQPQRDVRALLDADDKGLKDLRKAGFTAAHVVPQGRMLPGTGALVLLGGEQADDLVLDGEVSLFAQFSGARGVYPGTPMAIMAKMRQLYREAQRRQQLEALYADNPAGMERPDYDDVHYAFFPVLDGQQPIFYHAESALEAYRALDLQKDLGFPLILGGLNEAFDQIPALQAAGVPLFLTLGLPKKPQALAKAKTDSVDALIASYEPEFRTGTYRDVEAERRNLEARQAIARRKYVGTAAALRAAGLSFGFSTLDVKPSEIHDNLREMVMGGLNETDALAALTTVPAELLGVSRSMGTVEPGKLANLVVTTKPYFDEEAQVKYVFVDGVQHTYDTKKAKPEGDASAVVSASGSWTYTIATPQGEVGGTIILSGDPDNLTGTITNDMSPDAADLNDVTLEGNELTMSFDNDDMGTLTIVVVIDGDEMEGTISVSSFGEMPLSGTRSSGPQQR